MALTCKGVAAAYTPATTATLLTDQTRVDVDTPAIGDFVELTWATADEGSGYIVTVHTDGTITDGGSVSGKGGTPVRLESGTSNPAIIPIRGAARVHVSASSAFSATVQVRVGSM